MASSFFFYDVETSGFSPRLNRIMQFAGQRTDMNLKPIAKPVNKLIKLTADNLPDPEAVLVTGITPQQTIADGLSEADFLKFFYQDVAKPGTIFVGFNSIRFDDEFIRFLHYRNFYDAYEWQWKDGNSRWDLLDVVRMTRALRPDGIEWPFAADSKPTNRLEFLTKVNKLGHTHAHDALSDVQATIAVGRLIHEKQPELFDYLLKTRSKSVVKDLVLDGSPFVYTTSHYSSQFFHTSVAVLLAKHAQQDAALVYDLRYDPTPFLTMSVDELAVAWQFSRDPDHLRLPIKTLKYNRCPAVAPLGVIKDEKTQARLQLTLQAISQHLEILKKHRQAFATKVAEVVSHLDEKREQAQTALVDNQLTVDERLYDSFIDQADRVTMQAVRAVTPEELSQLASNFRDQRLKNLLPLYKARNYRQALSSSEQAAWEEFLSQKLMSGGSDSRLAKYFARLQELTSSKPTPKQQYLLEELKLYGESIVPADAIG